MRLEGMVTVCATRHQCPVAKTCGRALEKIVPFETVYIAYEPEKGEECSGYFFINVDYPLQQQNAVEKL